MKKITRILSISIVLVLLSVAMPLVFAAPKTGTCPITASTNIVAYGDTGFGGVGDLSKSWLTHFLDWWKTQDSSVNYVFLDKNDVKTDCNLANYPQVKLYIQPGGNAYYQQNALGAAGKANIAKYLDANRAYLGICAGFFYAANDYYWQGSYYNWPGMLDRFPTVEGSITNIADYDENPGYALTSLSNGHNAIYYGGPTQGWQNTQINLPLGAEKQASFAAIPGELPALVKYNKMLLSSVHLEAFENDGITGLSTTQRIENYKLLANNINEVAGTTFFVPTYTNPPQCSDGMDNDGDTAVDLADTGCSSVSDNDETDPLASQCSDGIDNDGDTLIDFPADAGCSSTSDEDEFNAAAPADLLIDNFDDGNLNGWTLTKASGANNWMVSTTDPFQGTPVAQSQPSSTSEPASNMEIGVSTSGYTTIVFSYNRKLVGLDAADEFKAKWFDGTSWNTVEQTASNSANDASYVTKSFTLPATAGDKPNFKIRFECTAGAVSEFCRVDNVKLAGQ